MNEKIKAKITEALLDQNKCPGNAVYDLISERDLSIIKKLKQIEQMSDLRDPFSAIDKMKWIATEIINQIKN